METEITDALANALKHADVIRTSDGYIFRKEGETWTDGDMTYDTLRDLIEAVEGEVEVISCSPIVL